MRKRNAARLFALRSTSENEQDERKSTAAQRLILLANCQKGGLEGFALQQRGCFRGPAPSLASKPAVSRLWVEKKGGGLGRHEAAHIQQQPGPAPGRRHGAHERRRTETRVIRLWRV